MIFQHTLDKVLSGEKTQTRRIQKAGHSITHMRYSWDEKIMAVGTMNRDLYRVGSTYAVQGGRGQKGVARILITDIRAEDVRNISDDDVKAEGFTSRDEFFNVWCAMHAENVFTDDKSGDYLLNHLKTCPNYLFQAWAITFKLVGGEA